jgi:protein-tyrosine-phosphatase
VIIHFICRGNCFRSVIAEAYVNSLGLPGITAVSSGTVAAADWAGNRPHFLAILDLLDKHGLRAFAKARHGDQLTPERLAGADLNVCLNQRVYDESLRCVTFPVRPLIWSVTDLGEPGRQWTNESQKDRYREEAYREITGNVDRLAATLPPSS